MNAFWSFQFLVCTKWRCNSRVQFVGKHSMCRCEIRVYNAFAINTKHSKSNECVYFLVIFFFGLEYICEIDDDSRSVITLLQTVHSIYSVRLKRASLFCHCFAPFVVTRIPRNSDASFRFKFFFSLTCVNGVMRFHSLKDFFLAQKRITILWTIRLFTQMKENAEGYTANSGILNVRFVSLFCYNWADDGKTTFI